MSVILYGLLFALIIFGIFKMYFYIRGLRTKLTPNCLLTKHPIVIMFPHILSRWNPFSASVKVDLSAHGYDVISTDPLTWPLMKELLKAHRTKYHLVYCRDVLSQKLLETLNQDPDKVSSLHRPKNYFEKFTRAHLQDAIQLAELDYKCSH